MSKNNLDQLKTEYLDLLQKAGFHVTNTELSNLEINDFGLGNIRKEGFGFIDILRSKRIRITLLLLLPNQSLPQHMHPSYENEEGKEETLRVLFGETKVFIEGESDSAIIIPEGKEKYYTALNEIHLKAGGQYSVQPNTKHWFQACDKGSVNICFQNRVDELRNIFYDPESDGCRISNDY